MKKLRSALILSFVISFMFFIFEPITMYANNVNDFWFDIYTLIGPTTLFFVISCLALSSLFSIVYVISKKLKRPGIYNFVLFFVGFCFICAYIHSNFLAGFLPPLDGTTFDWSDLTANIVSVVVCLIIAAAIIVAHKKLGSEKVSKYFSCCSLVIFAMLAISLISTCLTTSMFEEKNILALSTNKNLYSLSSDRNYVVLLVDAVDSVAFNKVVASNSEYTSALKDFSYFPDTVSGYAFTRDSIPFIFSSEWNENQKLFSEYSTEAFDNSAFFKALSERGYQKNLYEMELLWRSSKAFDFDNLVSIDGEVDLYQLAAQEVKYIMFKSLPFPLKRFSRVDSMHFEAAQNKAGNDTFTWWDAQFRDNHVGREADIVDDKMFQFIHLEGGHVPFDLDADLNPLPDGDGTYPEKLEATMKVIKTYIEYLKNNGSYDNSTIVLMADHGYNYDGSGRQNPILYIKGPNEHHEEMLTSNKQVSYADLCGTFIELLDGKSSTEVFADLPTDGRIRRYLHNSFQHEEHMIEYEQSGKAWDMTTFNPTGRSFDLK